jgi:hypothetical protein
MSQQDKIADTKAVRVDSFPWMMLFIIIQLILVAALFNPWVSALRWVSIIVIAIEALTIVFWVLPILLYQLVINRYSWRTSLRVMVKAVVDVLSFAGV